MSIFEMPSAAQSRPDEAMAQDEPRGGLDPRSVRIAGIITAALVVLGLMVSNAARPDPDVRPAVTSRVAPGAAAVEQAENVPAPAQPSVAPPNVDDEETAVSEEPAPPESDAPAWQDEQPISAESDSSGDGKWEDRHPGKGHGRWR